MMYDREKSDPAIVAVKPTNKAGQPAAELAEPRAGTKGNAGQHNTRRAQHRVSVLTTLERIRQAAVHTRGGSRMRESRTYGFERVAPCKRIELSRLKWRPRQSLASSRVPSLA